MSYQTGTATSYTDLLDKLNTFLTAKGSAFGLAYAGTGNGTLGAYSGGASSIAETFTITATSATNFSVVGSVSGSLGSATVGTPFAHAKLEFTITAGGTAFIAGDVFTINTAPAWTARRSSAASEYIWEAPGNGDQDAIFVGAKVFSNVTGDYYNWRLGGFSGFDSGQAFETQPGANTRAVTPLWNGSIPYWFVANGNRVIMVAKVSTVYEFAYLGFIDRLMSPNSYPYPLFVGGSMCWPSTSEPAATSSNWRWSYSGNEHAAFWHALGTNSSTLTSVPAAAQLRKADGTWRPFLAATGSTPTYQNSVVAGGPGIVWPYWCGVDNMGPNEDGSYPLFDIVLMETAAPNTYGYLDGIHYLPGYSIASESAITVGLHTYVAFQNVNRTSRAHYAALKLD